MSCLSSILIEGGIGTIGGVGASSRARVSWTPVLALVKIPKAELCKYFWQHEGMT